MNKAHANHFSFRPDPAIKHVLRGRNPAVGPASHDLTVQDVRIRNVSTYIRSAGGATEYDGNSIFVFETAQLCIAHLGHLHHTLPPRRKPQPGWLALRRAEMWLKDAMGSLKRIGERPYLLT